MAIVAGGLDLTTGSSTHATPEEQRLKTVRLLLRPLAPTHARAIAHLLESDSAAVRMTERLADPCDEAAARDWIDRRRGPDERTFAIDLRGTFIGCIGKTVGGREAGLGYWLGRPYWGQGFATSSDQLRSWRLRG